MIWTCQNLKGDAESVLLGEGRRGGADSTRRDILLLVAISPKQYK